MFRLTVVAALCGLVAGCAAEADEADHRPVEVFVDMPSPPVVLYVTHDVHGELCAVERERPNPECCPRGWSMVGLLVDMRWNGAAACVYDG
jgi:hypothetical protein